MSSIRALITKYPIIAVLAVAAATYYGGPKGVAMLSAVAKMLGL